MDSFTPIEPVALAAILHKTPGFGGAVKRQLLRATLAATADTRKTSSGK
ncbi:hypothetical protein [Altericroceibacterium xinjiangense]|nr:hypothetical protein [Altericroceibacterium xinjiangense]